MSTYHKVYRIHNLKDCAESDTMTLWEAARKLAETPSHKIQDSTVIAYCGRAVGFACFWKHKVSPMFSARKDERELLESWDFKTESGKSTKVS